EAGQTRQQTIEVLLLMEQLYQQDALYSTIKQEFTTEFDKYIDETITLDAQARYNQGKLIFEVASLFVGVGEIKGLLNTGKVTSETFQVLRKIPPSMVKFLKSATKFSKDAVLKLENASGKLLLEGQHIATITKQKLTIAKGALIESIDDNLKPIGELVTPDGYTLSMSDGRSLNERVLNIIEDAKGKYKLAASKLDNLITELNTINMSLNGKFHPVTGVPFVERIIEYKGEKFKGIFPKFEYKFKIKIPESLYLKKDLAQFGAATKVLQKQIEKNPDLKSKFTKIQLDDINTGVGRIDGLTWHHSEEPGILELV